MADERMERVTARQRSILMAIVERYIETGEPVGSGTVAALSGAAAVSPATVRNEMAALGEAGLLEQPHTSAGRVPTAKAFRLFVERLGPLALVSGGARLSDTSRLDIDRRFADVAGTQAVLERTSHVLAALSSGVGVAIAAVPDGDQLEHVHFSHLTAMRVLAVVVTRGGVVRDRVLALKTDLTALELETAARFLNENFRGWEIERVRAEIALRVERERSEYQRMLNSVEQLWVMAVPVTGGVSQTVYVEGVSNLVGSRPMGGADDRERLREMLGALETKQRLVDLLNAYIDTRQESVRVVFDLEEQAPEMAGLVLIAAPARIAGESRGTVAVIGPTRMQYERTMNAVGYIAQVLERQGMGFR
ncbi:heat-inducible transcriptional repressor HrcA [Granulicella tundricola]|uniref:Heat-inducible transcription repressor HrcA n=1 Tax=Granulicella tundricola (strain ATCC BAA-1859 / DSM 23138 / MP5ACTX9) TaxID=1198114 RepID=E8X579_GRATM|nr:heat-inducible transcriptional repressor HrcA [Granulicella tundricola]ADW68343.1 heat-inducible transcription repressor HrcA [Granulicella tundricola MP5ACTX9]